MSENEELGLTLEKVHELLDGVTEERDRLQHQQQAKEADPVELPSLCDAVLELEDLIGPRGPIRVPQKLVRAFTRTFTVVSGKEAYILASKVVSYLRSMEGEFSEKQPAPQLEVPAVNKVPDEQVTMSIVYADHWAMLPQEQSIKEKTAELALLLDSIIESARGSNLPEVDRALTAIERAQLIAILETALALLKAPMVEKGLLKKTRDGLLDAAKKTAQKKTEGGFSQLADEGGKLLAWLIDCIPWS